MNISTAESSKATEILKNILKLNSGNSSLASPASSVLTASPIVDAPRIYSAFKSLNDSALNLSVPFKKISKMASEDEIVDRQLIDLLGNDENVSYQINGTDVKITCRQLNHTSGSSKVKTKNLVNSLWDYGYYLGQLVSTHLAKVYMAYVIKLPGVEDQAIRVINQQTSERLLIKGMKGSVVDLSFAHLYTEVILGAIDEYGNVFIYNINKEGGQMKEKLILEIRKESKYGSSKCKLRRLIWCPYVDEPNVDEESDNSETSKLMVVTNTLEAEIWNVETVIRESGSRIVSTENISDGYQKIKEHTMAITDAAFPPDGSALATSSIDGSVKFYQINSLEENEHQQCLHNWIPHDGKPLSCVFFLDNKKASQTDAQYWKFAITGCDQNRELKVWNCASWICLQTIRFEPSESQQPELIANLDESSEYLILSNITYRVLYVLHIFRDGQNNTVKIISISEFAVTAPILSFDILDVGRRKFKQNSDDEQLEEFPNNDNAGIEDFTEETIKHDNVVEGVIVKLVYVQPKSLQECVIAFQTPDYVNQNSLHKISDVSFEDRCKFSTPSSNTLGEKSLLLTPDAFILPTTENGSANKSCPAVMNLLNLDDLTPPKQMSPLQNKPSDNTRSKTCSPVSKDDEPSKKRDSIKSTGSSPSLEVQEILNKSIEDLVDDVNTDLNLEISKISSEDNYGQPQNLINLISGQSSSEGFTVLSNVPCIPDDFAKKSSWPTVQQRQVLEEASAASPNVSHSQDKILLERISANMITLNQSMHNVLRLLDSQQGQISNAVDGINELKIVNASSKQLGMMANYQHELKSSVKSLLEKHHHAETSIIGGLLKAHEDRTMSALAQVVNSIGPNRLEHIIKNEFQTQIVPMLNNDMKHLEAAIHTELTTRLATTDSLLRENLHRLVESKSFLSSVSGSVATAIHGSLRTVFQDLVQSSVLPVFERLCQNMFLQLNETFKNGTKEYAQHLDTSIDKEYRLNQEHLTSQLQGVIKKVQVSTEQFTTSASTEIGLQLQSVLKRFEEDLTARMTSLLQEQMSVAMKEHQTVIGNTVVNAIRSRTVTPVPTDFQISQTHILQLINQGQINAAFKQALSVNDLSLVMFLCERVDPSQIFNHSPCPLQPPVLLALISQLSADFETQTERKHQYLKEALVNLDFDDPIISSHSPRVLETLRQKLQHFIQSHPSNKINKDIRLLLMATTSLMKTSSS